MGGGKAGIRPRMITMAPMKEVQSGHHVVRAGEEAGIDGVEHLVRYVIFGLVRKSGLAQNRVAIGVDVALPELVQMW